MSSQKVREAYVLEEVDLGPDDDDESFVFETVDVPSEEEETTFAEETTAEDEDFDAMVRSLAKTKLNATGKSGSTMNFGASGTVPRGEVSRRPEVIDDFIRNFLIKAGMMRTLESFQTEWYDAVASGKVDAQSLYSVPDVYLTNQSLEERLAQMEGELSHAKEVAHKAKATWDKFRKERDFHRMHHRRVVQEKNKLLQDLKRLQKHYENYEPTLQELKRKYELAMKEKMLTRIERDKIAARVDALEASVGSQPNTSPNSTAKQSSAPRKAQSSVKKNSASLVSAAHNSSSSASHVLSATNIHNSTSQNNNNNNTTSSSGNLHGVSELPSEPRRNPYLDMHFEPTPVSRFSLRNTRVNAHSMAVANIAVHPRKAVVATTSDDTTWKLWSVPSGELIMSGEGHRDWVAGCDFHPRGTHLATASGDSTVKIWDFATARCALTLSEHSQAVWAVAFHDTGDFAVSASLDHTAKLWDVAVGKSRMTLRGHLDSVNHVCFQPFSNLVATCSGDKTVSVWDARAGLCVQTFYGHQNAVNHVSFSLRGDALASADADGVVKVWDTRMVAERLDAHLGPHPANQAVFDCSGSVLAVASDDGTIKIVDLVAGDAQAGVLTGHEDAVQAVAMDREGKFMVSAGADGTFRYWSL